MPDTWISEKMSGKLKEIVTDQNEFNMIVDLLAVEKRYSYREEPQKIKQEFKILLEQYFKPDD